MCNFMLFYAFKMAVEQGSTECRFLKLNCFYSTYAKKRDSHGHLKCIKKLEITPKSCCLSAIMLCSIYFELL